MGRKGGGNTSNGGAGAQGKQNVQRYTIRTSNTDMPSASPSATPTKKVKTPSSPGRILALHNIPAAVKEADICALVGDMQLTGVKRAINSDTGEPSDIVFLLFGELTDAYRAFHKLGGRKIAGEIVRVNVVNGVKFESMSRTGKYCDHS